MPRLAQVTRIKILEEVSVHHKKVSAVCKKWGISRYTFYAWAKDYTSNKLIPDKTVRGIKHHSYIKGSKERYILDLVLKNPIWSFRQIANYLEKDNGGKYKTSLHGIANVLARNGLKDPEARRSFAARHPVKTTIAQRFSDYEKYKALEEWLQKKEKVSVVCRKYRISRFTFYSWLARYNKSQTVSALSSERPRGESHWRYLGEAVKKQVIDAVIYNPTYSVHMLHAHLNNEEALRLRSGSTIGHHAVQNILVRENLNTLEKRQTFAAGYMPEPKVQVAQLYEVPVPKLTVWRLLFAPFKTVPKWIIKHPISWPVVLPSIVFLAYIFEVDRAFKPTVFFPLVALTFGFFFFLYSLKYYISLIIVLRISQKGAGAGEQKKKGRIVSFLEKYFKLGSARISRVDPLLLNLDKVELARRPFVSIHLAIYNEKRVVERLIEACQNQEWGNYEVILADDSTDETTEIAKEVLAKDGRILARSLTDENLEIYISTPPVGSSLPVIKLIHRFSRDGFKGAALQKALENTDARAEYISVFDSDFVPYPDTIAQFVKTFQESCGGLDNVKDSNIAAVQGYQWHVLNKSQNWVTRGVRTEYAGSYVIERAGIGIYGGLNMIAGSVFCIRADLLRAFAWGRSITEDFELTLRLYERGYKVLFTPYIQAPAEAVSTVRRLIRQRMRWAEGHTFNVRKMAGRILSSPYVNRREKSEFIYLAPYYLQAAFFIVGTMAWFFSEIVLKVRLPFWTAAWGWSLVFVNFLALPLMNLVGLFLEESEERDYLGIGSFLVLSYILVPFQAYAAVKALFEKEEGPWFRTPKTGKVTDVFDRAHIYNWLEKLKIWGNNPGAGMANVPVPGGASVSGNLTLATVSAFNPLSGYSIKPKRVRFMARGALAVLLISVMFVNYLAFFAPAADAAFSSTPAVEQQINIVDKAFTTSGRDNGIVCITPASYSGTVTYYFEVVEKLSSAGTGGATLEYDTGPCSSGGSPGVGTQVSISTSMTTSYARYRSASFTPSGGMAWISAVSGTDASVISARVIITQTHATMLSKTETQVEVGSNGITASTSPLLINSVGIANHKTYCFNSTSTGATTCAAASPSRFSPTPTIYFEATLKSNNASGTATAGLYTAAGTLVTNSAVSMPNVSWGYMRSAAITLTAGTEYQVKISSNNASYTASIANAKIVLVQSDATNGVSAVETVQEYFNNLTTTQSTTYVAGTLYNSYSDSNFSGTVTLYHEADMYVALDSKVTTLTVDVDIITGSTHYGSVTSTSTTASRVRSTSITPALAVYDAEIKCTEGTAGWCTTLGSLVSATKNWLIIQLQSVPVPEAVIFTLPALLFLPKIISWWKRRGRDKRVGGKKKYRSLGLVNIVTWRTRINLPLNKLNGHGKIGFKC